LVEAKYKKKHYAQNKCIRGTGKLIHEDKGNQSISQIITKNPLTERQGRRHPVNVTVNRVQNQKLSTGQHLHGVRLNPELASIKHCLHGIPALKLHHWTTRDHCQRKFHEPKTSRKKKTEQNKRSKCGGRIRDPNLFWWWIS
jgi:hypothetical protein